MRAELAALTTRRTPLLDRLKADPAETLRAAGIKPDPWQADLMRARPRRTLMCCSRQTGKSTVAAAIALHEALVRAGALVLLLSPSLRQSGEIFRKTLEHYRAMGAPVPLTQESALQLTLANGSRIISLPSTEATVRCYSSVSLLVIDEASRVPDPLYYALRPMLAVSRGRLVALSTPWARLGWYFEAWHSQEDWTRVRVTAPECPRISPEFLEDELRSLGERWFKMEYLCEFADVITAVFDPKDIAAAFDNDVEPLFPEWRA